MNIFNPELQFKDTELTTRNKLKYLLAELKRFKFVTTLVFKFKKIESGDETKCSTFCLSSRPETIINEKNIDDSFEPFYNKIISNIKKLLKKVSGCIIHSVKNRTINMQAFKP